MYRSTLEAALPEVAVDWGIVGQACRWFTIHSESTDGRLTNGADGATRRPVLREVECRGWVLATRAAITGANRSRTLPELTEGRDGICT